MNNKSKWRLKWRPYVSRKLQAPCRLIATTFRSQASIVANEALKIGLQHLVSQYRAALEVAHGKQLLEAIEKKLNEEGEEDV
jgi:hypothetical protein